MTTYIVILIVSIIFSFIIGVLLGSKIKNKIMNRTSHSLFYLNDSKGVIMNLENNDYIKVNIQKDKIISLDKCLNCSSIEVEKNGKCSHCGTSRT